MNVTVEKHKDGTYWGTITEVPEVVASYGSTLAELKTNLQQAYTDHYELAVELRETMRKNWIPIPPVPTCST